ncbi:MAG: hypothetical protein IT561_06340 [Alphaproteobacteria bacterium]|nr:hypothetical protein [Alphaproteobacteria bacterium]
MQFHVVIRDFATSETPARRTAVRGAHLEGVKRLYREGRFLAGGPLLDAQGVMVGSAMFVDFPDEAALRARLAADPYTTGKVWDPATISIQPMIVADTRKL